MEKNLFIAIILSLIILLIYSSPQYQKRFGKEILTPPDIEKPEKFIPGKQETETPFVQESPPDRDSEYEKAPISEPEPVFQQIKAPSSEKNITLENEDLKILVSTRGGVITGVIIKKFNGFILYSFPV